jgi:hypothetical protein
VWGLTLPGRSASVARWLERYGPVAIRIAPGVASRLLRAEFEKLPSPWARLLSSVTVHSLDLAPSGTATLFVKDSSRKIDDFARSLGSHRSVVAIRNSHLPAPHVVDPDTFSTAASTDLWDNAP